MVALLAMALVAVACGDDNEPGAGDNGKASVDGSWLAVSGEVDGQPVALVDGWDVTMDIDGAAVGGTAACNGYGGTVAVGDDGSLTVGELSWTEMGCEPDVMELEQSFLRWLATVSSYELVDGRLTITGTDATWTFEPLAPVPTADIVGTTWVLDTYLDGDAATNVPGMEHATLILNADGTLTGSTGCRALSGAWIEVGAEIVFTDFAAAGECPADLRELDNWVVSVLGDGFRAEVDGRRLTMTSQGNEGLSYLAS